MRSEEADELMVRRFAMVEHPFGTLKCHAGYQHFLVRGFNKVRGEWSLMALCYNFTRVLNILGFDRFAPYLAEKARSRRSCRPQPHSGFDFAYPATILHENSATARSRTVSSCPSRLAGFSPSLVGQIRSW